ncbi:hypothetical protein B0T26DRAFT_675839 [Lasiosphaeria miniovina]|uniref:Uncharacterized protein n=1 Tax=Lasiosphaeria miniovina TaxID=1954250 RepID=A0AA40AKP9_9PEZI|nr:uncharacterized protein B0T26DRAFT_675839 [Lasiosphaeria miniovina]KAK0717555.1 hypothetical protein B0T26DRAFT_675839 [Lasiosphaeria miniovina]
MVVRKSAERSVWNGLEYLRYLLGLNDRAQRIEVGKIDFYDGQDIGMLLTQNFSVDLSDVPTVYINNVRLRPAVRKFPDNREKYNHMIGNPFWGRWCLAYMDRAIVLALVEEYLLHALGISEYKKWLRCSMIRAIWDSSPPLWNFTMMRQRRPVHILHYCEGRSKGLNPW